MSHSPGPWKFDEDWQRLPSVLDTRGRVVAIVEKWGMKVGLRYAPPAQEVADARLIASAPEMLAALELVRSIISEAALTGFNCKDGDWAERLFASQHVTFEAVKKAGGNTNSCKDLVLSS